MTMRRTGMRRVYPQRAAKHRYCITSASGGADVPRANSPGAKAPAPSLTGRWPTAHP